MNKPPEILAPVATWEMLHAAVHNGAHAVYLGLPHFNARGRTPDFSAEEIGKMIEYAHLYGVKVFLAANVLIFERELSEIQALLEEIIPYHPDAFIVQDLGLVRLIKEIAPSQAVHASTQMTVTNCEAIELTGDLKIERYVLGREVSIPEMAKIKSATTKELEVFVHGALCVSYSGQCLTSESNGGRSANRGQCAQSCRLPYTLVVDGVDTDLGSKKHLVSPQDLCGLADVDRLVAIGIDSFKIEGRYKSPEYVASAVRNYVGASEAACRGEKLDRIDERLDELGLTFLRGRFNGWFDGVNHQRLVDARYCGAKGNYIGEVVKRSGEGIELRIEGVLYPGDGIVLHDFESKRELGGVLYGVKRGAEGTVWVRFDREVSTEQVIPGMQVFHTSSPDLDRELKRTYTDKALHKKIPVHAIVRGGEGYPLELTYEDSEGNGVTAYSTALLTPARSAPLTELSTRNEIGALSGTPFVLDQLTFGVEGALFIHTKELKELRRACVEKLCAKRISRAPVILQSPTPRATQHVHVVSALPPKLSVMLRSESQVAALEDLVAAGIVVDLVYLDFEFNKEYEQSLARVRALGSKCGIATTRILKPGELGHLKYIHRLAPDLVLVRNLGALQFFKEKGLPLVGDFSLNVANSNTAHYLLTKGMKRCTPSYDLNREQLIELAKNLDSPEQLEVTVHQYMPAFHMEHCVFAAFLSQGTSYRDCGRPCEKHHVAMKDPHGVLHPLKPDAECRNTMFHGKPQSAARLIPDLLSHGVRHFRLEALYEAHDELKEKIAAYRAVIEEGAPAESIFTRLGIVERYGVTEGQLFNQSGYKDKKKYSSLGVVEG